jgi:prolyl-tRNA editing enzyme YbaK/EbsC (Cys-tRNA(Pro) deacylase)
LGRGQAAEAIGTALGSMVKSLCFVVAGQLVIVLNAGDRRVDDRRLMGVAKSPNPRLDFHSNQARRPPFARNINSLRGGGL